MATVGDIVVNLSANTQKFSGDLNRASGIMAGFATKIAGPAAIAYTAYRLLEKALNAIVSNTTEAIRAQLKLNSVLEATGHAAGKTADEIVRFADARQEITNFEDDVTIGAAALLATFKEVRGEAFERTLAAAQDLATVMDGDLDNAVRQVGRAMNDPVKGLGALRRAGVSFNAEQTEMIKRMQQSGDLMGAQQILLRELEGKFGGAAKALASPWEQLKNSVGNLAEEIGRKLKPASDSLFKSMREGVESVKKAIEGDGGGGGANGLGGGGLLTPEFVSLITGESAAIIQGRREREAMAARAKANAGNGKGFAIPVPDDAEEMLSAEDEFNKQLERSGEIMAGLRTPAEQLFSDFEEIQNRFAAGLLPEEALGRGFGRLMEGLSEIDKKSNSTLDQSRQAALQLVEDTKSPLQKFQDRIAEIKKLYGNEQDIVTPEVFSKAIEDARKKFLGSVDKGQVDTSPAPGVGALRRGSSEAFSTIQNAIRSGNGQPVNQIAKNTEQANKLAAEANSHLSRLATAQSEQQVVGL